MYTVVIKAIILKVLELQSVEYPGKMFMDALIKLFWKVMNKAVREGMIKNYM